MRHVRRDRRREEEMSDRKLNRDEIEKIAYQWILGRNGERDRIILVMYLCEGLTYAQMQSRLYGMGYELSIDRLKKVIRKRKEEFFSHIQDE